MHGRQQNSAHSVSAQDLVQGHQEDSLLDRKLDIKWCRCQRILVAPS